MKSLVKRQWLYKLALGFVIAICHQQEVVESFQATTTNAPLVRLSHFPTPPPTRALSSGYSRGRRCCPMAASSEAEEPSSTTTMQNEEADSSPLSQTFTSTLSFPPYNELMMLKSGEFSTSQTFSVPTNENGNSFDFCVKLYPQGGGHKASNSVLSGGSNSRNDGKVGVYLQFLPETSSKDTVDASFCLRLKGNQHRGRKFDIEWRSGMRFVPLEDSKLAEGRANDFGAHLMQTQMLKTFVGADDEESFAADNDVIVLEVEVVLHQSAQNTKQQVIEESSHNDPNGNESDGGFLRLKDVRNSDPELTRVGRIVVPVFRKFTQRDNMYALGSYPGVEYRILRIIDPSTEQDLFYRNPSGGVDYELKPIYPLIPQLERAWPVRVKDEDLPKLVTSNQYNLISAVGSLLTALTGLTLAFVVSQAVSVFFIPSLSMDPTLHVGDALLVDKVTPRLFPQKQPHVGDVVLFHPPTPLQELIAQSSGRPLSDRDLFVKRVAAVAGDTFSVVDQAGNVKINGQMPTGRRDLCQAEPLRLIEKYIQLNKDDDAGLVVPSNQVMVLGDCSFVSVDSRVWGSLPTDKIVGRPIMRIWPLSRLGPVPDLPTANAIWE